MIAQPQARAAIGAFLTAWIVGIPLAGAVLIWVERQHERLRLRHAPLILVCALLWPVTLVYAFVVERRDSVERQRKEIAEFYVPSPAPIEAVRSETKMPKGDFG